MAEYRYPDAIVSTEWLADHLEDPDLRIYESTVFLHHVEEGPDAPYRVESGRAQFEAAHIPTSGFIDIAEDLSDTSAPTNFMMPSAEQFAEAVGRAGLGDDARVVVYSRGNKQWSTRFWWMLRAMGFDNAAVLDGGWEKWIAEGRSASSSPAAYPPATFTPHPRPELFVGKDEVAASMGDAGTCTINALLEGLHRGESTLWPCRPYPRQRKPALRRTARSGVQYVPAAGRGPGTVQCDRLHAGQEIDRVLRRRYCRDTGCISASPAWV
jgi:thiosulfate/3-mercaptopyruvate sulfurtransferase